MKKFEIYKENLPHHIHYQEAVKQCSNLGNGWRLPTKEELIEMFEMQKRGEITFGNYGCWSGTEDESKMVWSLGFLTGNIYLNPKTNLNLVRPVRDGKKVDKEYWASELPRPLSPSDEDVEVFKKFMVEGATLLLGCTKKLIPLSDIQMDNDPWYEGENVIKQDWTTNDVYFENIIGDGVLNFTHELAEDIIHMCSKTCKVFIVRVFTKKLDTMRIADNFPTPSQFTIPPNEIRIKPDYAFYIWRF
jgi:hypothetical protein